MTSILAPTATRPTDEEMPEAPSAGAREEREPEGADEAPLLFCPFCRECFEGEEVCPDHELTLVPFERLPKRLDVDDTPGDEEALQMYDPRFGRGWLMGAALLSLVGFVLPMVTTSSAEDSIVSTGMEVASRVAPNLFVIPAIAMGIMSILFRRRTLQAMRGARLVVPAMAGVGVFSLAYTLYRIREGAVQLSEELGTTVTTEPEIGVWVMAFGMATALFAGLRLGAVRRKAGLPHGAEPEGDSGIVVEDE
jgi:hypothetical protein